jgi:putative CocE/NonD family hydrolase
VPPTGAGALDYVFDPRDPAPTRGGAISSGEPVMHAGAFDQSAVANRSDVLVFTTSPLDDDFEIVGPITAHLWIASDALDTDFTAKLIDLYPPSADDPAGFAMNLTEGLLRVRYRDSWERPSLMTPGEVYAITVELFPVANLFRPGPRLRLDITSSNFPHFDVNPNSGEPEGSWLHPRPARNRVFAAAERPSHILLPVIPRGIGGTP